MFPQFFNVCWNGGGSVEMVLFAFLGPPALLLHDTAIV